MNNHLDHYRIGVIGLGFVGLTLSVVLANNGFNVYGVDTDLNKVELIKNRKTPFYEEKIEYYLEKVVDDKLIVSTDYNVLRDTNIVFITVGTPSENNGSQRLDYVIEAVNRLSNVWKNIDSYRLLVVKSTVLPGTTRKLAKIMSDKTGLEIGRELGVVFNPEFLREGSAIEDMEKPSRIVIGCIDEKSCRIIRTLWEELYRRLNTEVKIREMSLEEAELVKYASNIFLAMRISYVNTIANICEEIPNCDVNKVLEATGLDPRIGSHYLEPGLGYGGSCLPKDIKSFIWFSKNKLGYKPVLIESIDKVNEKQPYRALEYLIKEYGDLSDKVIGILGLAFKPNTDDIRESISLKIIDKLLEMKSKIKVHDPKAMDNVKKIYGDKLVYCNNPIDAIKDSDAVIIATAWREYRRLKPEDYLRLMRNPVVIDGRRIYDNYRDFVEKGVKFYAIGLSRKQCL